MSRRLVRNDLSPTPNPETLRFTLSEIDQPQVHKDLCYPIGFVQPSCIRLPQTTSNNFEIKPQIISMLPKFTRIEDANIFMREFEEVCATMKLQHLTKDALKLRLINFALKDSAKKWLYSLPNQ